ncbi:MAG: hypothetical protein PUE35_00480 [Bacteroidales bacterium]|nr:hypothetical protein [Bacteroidales bacterium]
MSGSLAAGSFAPPLPSSLIPPLGANPTVSGSLAAGSFASLPIQPHPSSWGESYFVRQFGCRIFRLPPPSRLSPPLGANPTVSGSLAAGSFAPLPPSEIFSSLTSSV